MGDRYNGWTNYETWNIALWIGNEEGSASYWHGAAEDAYTAAVAYKSFTRVERAALDLADTMKAEFEQANPLGDLANCWSDLLSAALSEVNWYEIATHYIDDISGDIDAEEAATVIDEE